jgi:hypothetical protein
MATDKSNKKYLDKQVAAAKSAGASKQQLASITSALKGKTGIKSGDVNTPGSLQYIDNQLNQLLYGVSGSGEGGIAGKAAPNYVPPKEEQKQTPDLYAYEKEVKAENRRSAYAILEKEFTDNNLTSLLPEIKKFMTEGYSPEEASLLLPETPAYKTRFIGNEGRKKLGLPFYNPAQYLTAEQTYRDLFNQYSLGELANQETYSALIGGAVSIDEAKARVDNVFTKIDNAPDVLKTQLSNYFGGYGVGDPTKQRSQIALALMKGTEGISQLDTNLRKAQIRTGAAMSNVNVAEENVSQLEKQLTTAGMSTEQIGNLAKEAYANIAEVQPTTEKLAQIYGEDTSMLSNELQQEAFFGLASQRRKKLQEREKSTFSGQAGTSTASLSRQSTGAF